MSLAVAGYTPAERLPVASEPPPVALTREARSMCPGRRASGKTTTLLVLLTFTIFWMDRESLGDRMDISFIEAALGLIGADRSEPAQANRTFICVVERLGVHI